MTIDCGEMVYEGKMRILRVCQHNMPKELYVMEAQRLPAMVYLYLLHKGGVELRS